MSIFKETINQSYTNLRLANTTNKENFGDSNKQNEQFLNILNETNF